MSFSVDVDLFHSKNTDNPNMENISNIPIKNGYLKQENVVIQTIFPIQNEIIQTGKKNMEQYNLKYIPGRIFEVYPQRLKS